MPHRWASGPGASTTSTRWCAENSPKRCRDHDSFPRRCGTPRQAAGKAISCRDHDTFAVRPAAIYGFPYLAGHRSTCVDSISAICVDPISAIWADPICRIWAAQPLTSGGGSLPPRSGEVVGTGNIFQIWKVRQLTFRRFRGKVGRWDLAGRHTVEHRRGPRGRTASPMKPAKCRLARPPPHAAERRLIAHAVARSPSGYRLSQRPSSTHHRRPPTALSVGRCPVKKHTLRSPASHRRSSAG
jgi:hypothetical protein